MSREWTFRPARDPGRDRAESIELVEQLVAAIPEVRPLFDDNVRIYGELLPSLLVSDVDRWFVDLHRECAVDPPSESSCALFHRIGDFLEDNYRDLTSDAMGDVIVTCFLEELQGPGDNHAGLKETMARWPTLKAWIDQYGW